MRPAVVPLCNGPAEGQYTKVQATCQTTKRCDGGQAAHILEVDLFEGREGVQAPEVRQEVEVVEEKSAG
eukprot:10210133-Alexandrium_andersonii.AAC.1